MDLMNIGKDVKTTYFSYTSESRAYCVTHHFTKSPTDITEKYIVLLELFLNTV